MTMQFFSLPKKLCPKHGEVDQFITIRMPGREAEFCLRCYVDWIEANIPRVTELPSQGHAEET